MMELAQSYQQLVKDETNFLKNQELDKSDRRYTDDENGRPTRERLYTLEEEQMMRISYASKQ